jgi:hypothetical protein
MKEQKSTDQVTRLFTKENDVKKEVPFNSSVSMNFWCFHPNLFNHTERLFHQFLQDNTENLKAEFFIPIPADDFVKSGRNHPGHSLFGTMVWCYLQRRCPFCKSKFG